MARQTFTDMCRSTTALYVIDPQVRECSMVEGFGTARTEQAVEKICEAVHAFRRVGIPVYWSWSKLDTSGVYQQPQKLPDTAKKHEFLTRDIRTSLGGIHRRIQPLMEPDLGAGRVFAKYTRSLLAGSKAARSHFMGHGKPHILLAGFNYSDCVTFTAIGMQTAYHVPRHQVTILSDASADNRVIEHEEMWNDCGMGESYPSFLRQAHEIQSKKLADVFVKLGL